MALQPSHKMNQQPVVNGAPVVRPDHLDQDAVGFSLAANQHTDKPLARLGDIGDLTEVNSGAFSFQSHQAIRIKRMEHDRQRIEQLRIFESKMKLLEAKQQREEQDLIRISAPSSPQLGATDGSTASSQTVPRSMPGSRRQSQYGTVDVASELAQNLAQLDFDDPKRVFQIFGDESPVPFESNERRHVSGGPPPVMQSMPRSEPHSRPRSGSSGLWFDPRFEANQRTIMPALDDLRARSGWQRNQFWEWPQPARNVSRDASERLAKSQTSSPASKTKPFDSAFGALPRPGFRTPAAGFSRSGSASPAIGISPQLGPFSPQLNAPIDVNAAWFQAASPRQESPADLVNMRDQIGRLCRDQNGCRFLQRCLEERNPEQRHWILTEILHDLADITTNPFGNYLCQKLIQVSTDDEKDSFCEAARDHLFMIALNPHGTRVVQTMLDCMSTTRQVCNIIMALSNRIVALAKDNNGNHVVQRCLDKLPMADNQFIYNAVVSHCVEISIHRHGCVVIQRCLDHAAPAQRQQLAAEIVHNTLSLVQDPFGNYVVSHLIENWPEYVTPIISRFLGHIKFLSMQKYSSNVVEKAIGLAPLGSDARRLLVDEIGRDGVLEELMVDGFGNYVAQKVGRELSDKILRHMTLVRGKPWERRMEKAARGVA